MSSVTITKDPPEPNPPACQSVLKYANILIHEKKNNPGNPDFRRGELCILVGAEEWKESFKPPFQLNQMQPAPRNIGAAHPQLF